MIESDDDRLAYLQAFGNQYQSSKGPVWGIFSNAYASTLGDVDLEGTAPSLLVRTLDADKLVKDDVIETTPAYRVDRKEPDESRDMTLLVLKL